MSATLVAKDLTGGHAHRILFDSLNLTVAPGDVIGVVGGNGAGKSTLLRVLAGLDKPQGGSVSFSPTDAFVGFLPQEHERREGESIAAYIGRRTGCTDATSAMDAAAIALGNTEPPSPGGPDAADTYSAALDHWLACGAADLEDRLPAVLADLGLILVAQSTERPTDSGVDSGIESTVGATHLSADSLMTSLSGGPGGQGWARGSPSLSVRHRFA